jgi:hypothetical protein
VVTTTAEADEFHHNAQAIIAAMRQRGVTTIGELVAAVAQEQKDGGATDPNG